MPADQLLLYSMQRSMNSYKVRLALSHLGLPYGLREVDILHGDNRTPEFLAINPFGRVPVLQVGEGNFLAESNAIMLFLAKNSDLIPADPFTRGHMLQWLFFEQNTHEPAIGTARFWLALVPGGRALKEDLLDDWMERGEQALSIMDRHLAARRFFVGDIPSLADIALYANTHVAEEAGFTLAAYESVQRWLKDMAALPRHIGIDHRPSTIDHRPSTIDHRPHD